MMPTFPSPPLKFRTVSFPQYGFKVGISGAAFPARGVFPTAGLPSPFVPFADHVLLPVLCRGTRCAWAPPFEQLLPLYPRGPRSGPGYVVPVHPHLSDPMRPTHKHIPTSPPGGLYEMPSLCAYTTTPRQPTSGSVLSLSVLYRHVVP
jgi:hypothetical protein